MTRIKGVCVRLAVRTESGKDAFGKAIFREYWKTVPDVLIAPSSTGDIVNGSQMDGKKIVLQLAIPKGDTNDWINTDVILPPPFAGKYRTVGTETAGIEQNIPLSWNKKVTVERYE